MGQRKNRQNQNRQNRRHPPKKSKWIFGKKLNGVSSIRQKTLSDLIEAEVQKRIKRQEWFYWTFIALFVAFITIFSITFWHAELKEVLQPSNTKRTFQTKEL